MTNSDIPYNLHGRITTVNDNNTKLGSDVTIQPNPSYIVNISLHGYVVSVK